MRAETPSLTAAFVAAARHLGQLLPPGGRLVDDPYGAAFVSPAVARVLDREALRLRPLSVVPGLREWLLYMQVRTRVIDDALVEFLRGGGRQLVVLGAGYDCRALRIPELANANIFEVDHPATQGHKREVLDRIGADSPSSYVTWDFETRPMEDLPDTLADAGLDRADPVFTIWEGVTMYLTEAAIDASLRAIRTWSVAGSQLAMTYFAKSRITHPSLLTRAMQAVVSTFGEPWRFGWVPHELPIYLAERSFQLMRDTAMSEAAQDLLPPALAAHVANPDRRFALASAHESIAVVRSSAGGRIREAE
jgi:methyltransferase (TIGR00027 family)